MVNHSLNGLRKSCRYRGVAVKPGLSSWPDISQGAGWSSITLGIKLFGGGGGRGGKGGEGGAPTFEWISKPETELMVIMNQG